MEANWGGGGGEGKGVGGLPYKKGWGTCCTLSSLKITKKVHSVSFLTTFQGIEPKKK